MSATVPPRPALSVEEATQAALVASTAAKKLAAKVHDALRPLFPRDGRFRMCLTVAVRDGTLRVEIQPEPFRGPGWQDCSG